jgi:hypothetical protein
MIPGKTSHMRLQNHVIISETATLRAASRVLREALERARIGS